MAILDGQDKHPCLAMPNEVTRKARRIPFKTHMKQKVQIAFGSAILTLMVVGALSYRTILVSNESEEWIQHTHQVLESVQGVLLSSQSIEAAYRGFVITGDEAFLTRYKANVARLRRQQATLSSLTVDNAAQQARLPELKALEEQKIQFAESVVALRRSKGLAGAAALVQSGDGERLMNDFRDRVRQIRQEELRLLADRKAIADRRLAETKIALLLCVLVGLIVATGAIWSANRESFARQMAEESLRGSEAKFRGLLEAAPDAMVVFNQDWEVVLLNAQTENAFGYSRAELVGQNVHNIIPCELGEDERDTLLAAGRPLELTGHRKDGREFPVEIMVSPLESEDGMLRTASIRDITERRLADARLAEVAAELRRSNIDLQQFAYVASHDLQEPLRMVASYTSLLAKRYQGKLDSDADQFIEFAVDGCNRMKRLIEDLLAFSRAGMQANQLRDVVVETALRNALTNLRGSIQDSKATITYEGLPTLTTDPMLLSQILQNLVGNAIKYRGVAAPEVHVSARKLAQEWIFSVQDNGVGIEPQFHEKIFRLFQRLHGRGEFEGTGIGLAICKKLVDRLGGRIWVESRPGEGSTFLFSLPEVSERETVGRESTLPSLVRLGPAGLAVSQATGQAASTGLQAL